MRFRYLMRFRYYRQIILTFFTIGFVIIATSMVGMFYVYSHIAEKQVGELSVEALEKSSVYYEGLLNECQKTCESLLVEKECLTVTSSWNISRIDEYRLMQKIRSLVSSDSKIQYLGVYNGRLNRYVGTRGVYFDEGHKIERYISKTGRYTLVAREVKDYENTNRSTMKKVLSYIYQPYTYQKSGSCIVMDLDYTAISDAFLIKGKIDGAHLFLLNNDLQIVFSTNSVTDDSGKDDIKPSELIQDNLYEEERGYHTVRKSLLSERYLVSHYKVPNIPWILVSVTKDSLVSGKYAELLVMLLVILAIVIVTYIILSIIFTRLIYKPVNSIREQLEESLQDEPLPDNRSGEQGTIRDEFEHVRQILQYYRESRKLYNTSANGDERILQSVIQQGEDVTDGQIMKWEENCSELLHDIFRGCEYCVVMIQISEKEESHDTNKVLIAPLTTVLLRLVQDRFRMKHIDVAGMLYDKEVLLVCKCGNDGEIPVKLSMALEEFILQMQQEYGINLLVGCGKVKSGIRELRSACLSAESAMMQLMWNGKEPLRYDKEEPTVLDQLYPSELEKAIFVSIKEQNEAALERNVELFFEHLNQCKSGSKSLYYVQRLYAYIYYQTVSIGSSKMYELWHNARYYRGISFFNSYKMMRESFLTMCREIMRSLDESNKDKGISRCALEDPVSMAATYMIEHYDDPDISLTLLAEKVNLTPAYLGQLFSKTMGLNCNEYLLRLRMEKASEMLLQTEQPVHSISEAVGILNTNYFYTLFKKYYGVTPFQYRKGERKQNRKA